MPDDRLKSTTVAVSRPGVIDRLTGTVEDAFRLLVDHLELATLEAQRLAEGLVQVVVAAIVVSVLVVAAWMAIVAGGTIWATRAGMSLPSALVLAAVINLALAVTTALWIRARLPQLTFTATLRQLRQDKDTIRDENDRTV